MSCTFYQGDVFEKISRIPEKSVDFLYIDPPFGTTRCSWDEKLNWAKLFTEFFRVLKVDGILAIHCSVPFNYTLIREAPKAPNYSWYWKKDRATNPLMAKQQPLRNTEEILVWYNKKARFYPQRHGTDTRLQRGMSTKTAYYGNVSEQPWKEVVGRYYTHHLDFKRNVDGYSTRPNEMVELMYKCYTKPGQTVLDCFCHHGMSGVIAKKLGLHWIGIDKHFLPCKLIE